MKRIPREQIRHLEWNPAQPTPSVPTPPTPSPLPSPSSQLSQYSVDDILNGRIFFSDRKEDEKWVGLPIALEEAIAYAGKDGIVTMPEFVAAKAHVPKTHGFWKNWHTVHTEENIGIDTEGRFYERNQPVLVVMHGGGLLTPERIKQAYKDGLLANSARYTPDEFNSLLTGELPDGKFPLFKLEDVTESLAVPHRFGIVMPYSDAQATPSSYHSKEDFLQNKLVIARCAGSLDKLAAFYDKAKGSSGVGNWHPFAGRDPSTPQGRVLFVGYSYYGLDGGINLNLDGRFVGVAPKAP